MKRNTLYYITVCLFVLILFPKTGYSQKKDGQGIIEIIDNNTVSVSLLKVDGLFERMWLYHEIASKNLNFTKIADEGKIIINTTGYDQDEVFELILQNISKTKELSSNYDKATLGSLMSTCQDLYGNDLMDFVMGVRSVLDTENDSCHNSAPFCTGTIYSFAAGVNSGNGQLGPNYGCLGSTPNPVWYHMRIDQPGDITIRMVGKRTNGASLDIDFALWGPYEDPVTPCVAQLTANCTSCPNNTSNPNFYPSGNLHDCSYDGSSVEHAHIVGGQTGQYYIMIITNYANAAGNITFSQTAGNGTTDCTILPPAASSNSPVCVGETIELHAANAPGASYQWSGPNGFMSNQQNPTIANAQHSHAGVYSVTITVQGQQSDPSITEVYVFDPPVGTLTASSPTTICKGDTVQLTITAVGNGPYRATLNTGSGFPMVLNFWQSPYTINVMPIDTTTYTLTTIQNNACSGTASGSVTVNVRPKPLPAFMVSNQCATLSTQFTDASSVTGGTISAWDWDFGDGTPHSNLENPVHSYASQGNYNVIQNVTANNGCSKRDTVDILIKPTPTVNAGTDASIPYGANTQLTGTASGGSGSHTYLWIPSDKVVDATILNPMTILLQNTVDFVLTASDQNGCEKSDDVTITVTGGPLNAVVTPSPSEICIGESTLLNAIPSGGTGDYTYTWTSNPPGFTSTEEDPTVSPSVTTTYFVAIFDNFTTINAQATVTVNQKPIVDAGADQGIPHGTTTTLSSTVTGGTSPYQYLWGPANFVVNPMNPSTATTKLYSSQIFNLKVTDVKGCDQTDILSVSISGGPLAVNPTAVKPIICRNESTVIQALPGGGSGNYVSFQWTSNPPGFTSNVASPEVSPTQTTTYNVTVDDGFNTISGSVTVTVNQLPVIDLIPNDPRVLKISDTEIGICVFDSIPLDAGNEDAEFLWSNGSTKQSITIATSGISYDQQEYTVTVTDPLTLCSNTAEITAYFTFENCSYGIEERDIDNRVTVFPNPSSSGVFNLKMEELGGNTRIDVFNTFGQLVYTREYMLNKSSTLRDEINLSNAPNGVYFLKIKNSETTLSKKLIIR